MCATANGEDMQIGKRAHVQHASKWCMRMYMSVKNKRGSPTRNGGWLNCGVVPARSSALLFRRLGQLARLPLQARLQSRCLRQQRLQRRTRLSLSLAFGGQQPSPRR